MSKKTNTLLFILIATLFNVLVTVFCFVAFLIICTKFFIPVIPESMSPWIMPVLFVASIVASFLVYRLVMKILMKKVNIEKYFDPIFGKRRPPGKN